MGVLILKLERIKEEGKGKREKRIGKNNRMGQGGWWGKEEERGERGKGEGWREGVDGTLGYIHHHHHHSSDKVPLIVMQYSV